MSTLYITIGNTTLNATLRGSNSDDTFLVKANNLSDISNRQTALDNLTGVDNATVGYVLTKDSNGNTVFQAAPGASGGEANTASNVGSSGVGIFKQKTAYDLEFKKINAGSSKVTIIDDTGNDDVDIDIAEANIDLSNCNNSTSVFITASGVTYENLNTNGDVGTGASQVAAGNHTHDYDDGALTDLPTEIGIACSDETTDLTTGTAKATFRMPFAMTLNEVRANVNTAPVGSTITVDINESGTTILSTKLTIDAGEKTSETAATPAVISDSSLEDDSEITIDIDQIGSSTAGKGLKVWLIGKRA